MQRYANGKNKSHAPFELTMVCAWSPKCFRILNCHMLIILCNQSQNMIGHLNRIKKKKVILLFNPIYQVINLSQIKQTMKRQQLDLLEWMVSL